MIEKSKAGGFTCIVFADCFCSDLLSSDSSLKDFLVKTGRDPYQLPRSQQEGVFYPTRKIRIPVNKENVLKSGIVKPEDSDKIVSYIDIDLPETALLKNQMMILLNYLLRLVK